jgi:hypothetical protein
MWVVNATPRPFYRRARDRVAIVQGRSGPVRKFWPPTGIIFVCSLCTFQYFSALIVLAFAVCPYCTTHTQNTNIHAPGGIRTPNPSKRSAAELGHCDGRSRSSGRPAGSESLYQLRCQDSRRRMDGVVPSLLWTWVCEPWISVPFNVHVN